MKNTNTKKENCYNSIENKINTKKLSNCVSEVEIGVVDPERTKAWLPTSIKEVQNILRFLA